ncbi:MAG: glycosyltransferase [Lachnospiraceae bacterium]|nr:glycosyltransferase [Lachnospiraceae bacterium]
MNEKINEIFTGERFVPGINDTKLELEHYQRYYSILPLVKDKVVLDAACGEGYGTNILSASAASVSGIDISEEAIERAKEKYQIRQNICYQTGSVESLPYPDHSIDVVVSFETIEHISEEVQSKFLEEIFRVLKKDGLLVMSTPNKAIYSDLYNYCNEFHVKEFYNEEFLTFLKKKFRFVQLYNQYFEMVSIIDKSDRQTGNVSYVKTSQCTNEGKYYIALASNKEIPEAADITHIMMNSRGEYQHLTERILTLQGEVESRNKHLAFLDNEIENYRKRIGESENDTKALNTLNSKLNEQLTASKQDNEQLLKKNDDLIFHNRELELEVQKVARQRDEALKTNKSLEAKLETADHQNALSEAKISQLEQTICNKNGHIELLLEVEREYEREKQSRTYKLALKFRKLSLWLLPANSKRRFFMGLIKKALCHPRLMLKMINPRRIKNCFTILKTEGIQSAVNHYQLVEEYEKSRTVPLNQENLDIVKITDVENKFEDYAKLTFPKWDTPQVSIVIPVYNQFDYTYHCLESILKNSGNCTYEVILANDCSTDLTKRIEEIVEGITVITNEKNLRFLLNCNHAAEYAKGQYLLFLNNDTQVQDNWLEPLLDLMRKDSSVGMVGSKLIYSDGYLQEAGGILWKDASAWNYGSRQNPNDSEFNYVHEADYISGAAIMIRSSLWKEIGGFDTRFVPAYCEDSDLAFEVRKHGYKVMYQPKSVVVHFEGISNGTDVTSGQKKYQVENQKKFYDKWKDELEKNHFENGTNVFLARERSRDKKHVLVIDHYVPQYDKDAGSKTTFMYLKMLIQKGYQVTFLGDNFYQHEPYTTELQQMGILVLYGPKYAENWKKWLLENMQYFDVFYLNRPHITIKYIDLIKEHARGKIIYYGHDLHFLRTRREYELNGDKKLLEESQKWQDQEMYIMHKADMNYYPSAIESDEIHRLDPMIPVKAITAYVFDTFRKPAYNADNREGMLFVGGFGHGPNLDAVLWFLDKIFPEVYRKTKAPFYIVGSKAPEEITRIKTEGVIVKGFVSEEELQRLYDSCRIAVVPLRYGAGVKGKVVEALYYGIPVVTTSVGAEGITGIEDMAAIRDREDELIQIISELYENNEELVRMSEASQQFIREYFSTEAVWNVIKDDFS